VIRRLPLLRSPPAGRLPQLCEGIRLRPSLEGQASRPRRTRWRRTPGAHGCITQAPHDAW
jgi:hypothetical protein